MLAFVSEDGAIRAGREISVSQRKQGLAQP